MRDPKPQTQKGIYTLSHTFKHSTTRQHAGSSSLLKKLKAPPGGFPNERYPSGGLHNKDKQYFGVFFGIPLFRETTIFPHLSHEVLIEKVRLKVRIN